MGADVMMEQLLKEVTYLTRKALRARAKQLKTEVIDSYIAPEEEVGDRMQHAMVKVTQFISFVYDIKVIKNLVLGIMRTPPESKLESHQKIWRFKKLRD